MPTASVNGLDVYYELHGDGPPLLNIGGTGGDLRRTPAVANPLTRSFTVLAYDQRGLGRTRGGEEREPTMADYADDAAALMSTIGWSRAHVVGTSFGGMVALNLAVRHPARIDRLVLCCTSPGGLHPSYPLHELLADPDPDTDRMERTFATRMRLTDRRWDPDAAEPIPGLGAFYEVMAADARRVLPPAAATGLRRQLAARAGHDVEDLLGSIDRPTLVCAGRYDDLAPLANSELLAARIPGARLEMFDGGHIFMIQDRTAFPTIIDFLERPASA